MKCMVSIPAADNIPLPRKYTYWKSMKPVFRIRTFFGLPDPLLLVRTQILKVTSKNTRKTLISTVLRFLNVNVNVPLVSNNQ
jgi:hypothetical protein